MAHAGLASLREVIGQQTLHNKQDDVLPREGIARFQDLQWRDHTSTMATKETEEESSVRPTQ